MSCNLLSSGSPEPGKISFFSSPLIFTVGSNTWLQSQCCTYKGSCWLDTLFSDTVKRGNSYLLNHRLITLCWNWRVAQGCFIQATTLGDFLHCFLVLFLDRHAGVLKAWDWKLWIMGPFLCSPPEFFRVYAGTVYRDSLPPRQPLCAGHLPRTHKQNPSTSQPTLLELILTCKVPKN